MRLLELAGRSTWPAAATAASSSTSTPRADLGRTWPAGPVRLSVRTSYPWDGRVTVEVVQAPERPWTLSLRVPGVVPVGGVSPGPARAGPGGAGDAGTPS